MKYITVFCGSKLGTDPELVAATKTFVNFIAEQGIGIVYGGANAGLMKVVADTALDAGVDVIGVMPVELEGKERIHPSLTKLINVDSMQARKTKMIALGDAAVALPGGSGTLDEFFEVFTLSQIGAIKKPCALFNAANYFDSLIKFTCEMCEKGFLHPDYLDMLIAESNPQVLLNKLLNFKHPHNK